MLRALDKLVNSGERDIEVDVAVAVGLAFDAGRARFARAMSCAELSWVGATLAKKNVGLEWSEICFLWYRGFTGVVSVIACLRQLRT
jgi:hypothetical protein